MDEGCLRRIRDACVLFCSGRYREPGTGGGVGVYSISVVGRNYPWRRRLGTEFRQLPEWISEGSGEAGVRGGALDFRARLPVLTKVDRNCACYCGGAA